VILSFVIKLSTIFQAQLTISSLTLSSIFSHGFLLDIIRRFCVFTLKKLSISVNNSFLSKVFKREINKSKILSNSGTLSIYSLIFGIFLNSFI
jgi:hypothetical protein